MKLDKVQKSIKSKTQINTDINIGKIQDDSKDKKQYCCTACGHSYSKQKGNFSISYSPLFAGNNGYVTVCNSCRDKYFNTLTEYFCDNQEKALDRICGIFDWYYEDGAVASTKKISADRSRVGAYPSKMCLPQTKDNGTTYLDTIRDRESISIFSTSNIDELKKSKLQEEDTIYYLHEDETFEVTDDIIRLFGAGYKKHVYKAMWDKYQFLKTSYPDVTNLHVEALVTYVRFKVKEEFATARGDVTEAEKWNTAALKASDKAKINPNQLSQSDLQGGLNSFCELIQAVEQSVDIIPILPQFKYSPKDAIDFNIYCLVNYLRDLEGKPLCDYSDIYKFYDERKKEYIEENGDIYGIFTDDTSEFNREQIQKFITLPKDYNDDLTDDEDGGEVEDVN